MQDSTVVITDIKDAMKDCIENLEDLQKEETSLPFESKKIDGDLLIWPALTYLPATIKFKKVTKKLKVIQLQLKFSSITSIK